MSSRICIAAAVLLCASGRRALSQTCSTSATALAFGNYQPLTGATTTSTATVTVTCNPGLTSLLVGYTVKLSAGGSGSFVTRTLSGGTGRLNYQIYTDTLLTQVWGDGTGGSTYISDGYILGLIFPVVKNYTAYGKIGASQTVPIGSYMDMISILITY